MEKFQEAKEKAKRNIQIADHMLSVTYTLVKDNKLLLAILENIFLAMTNAMAAVLYYERLFKRVPPFHDNFESKFNLFKSRLGQYDIDRNYLVLMQEIKNIILEHKKSSVEFSKTDKFVICTDTYKIRTISLEQIKKYIADAKSFVSETSSIVSKNEAIFIKNERKF